MKFLPIILSLFASYATFAEDIDHSVLFEGKHLDVKDRNRLTVLRFTKIKVFQQSDSQKTWRPELTFDVTNVADDALDSLRFWAVITKKDGSKVEKSFRFSYLNPNSISSAKLSHSVAVDEFKSLVFELDEDFQSPEDLRLAAMAKAKEERAKAQSEERLRSDNKDVTGWGKTEWGMTLEQVKAIHPDLAPLPNPSNPKLITPALRDFVIDDIPFFVGMDFTKGKLSMVRLICRAPTLVKAIAQYSHFNGLISVKYGEPTDYSTKPTTVGNQTFLTALWKVPSTTVLMKCGSGDGHPGCAIFYMPASPTKEVLDKL